MRTCAPLTALAALFAVPGCSAEEAPPPPPLQSEDDGAQAAGRIVTLDPADPAAQAELARYANDARLAEGARLLSLRRLEAGGDAATEILVDTATAILAGTTPQDAAVRQLRANSVAALVRADTPESRAAVEHERASTDAAWRAVVLAVVAEVRP